jgi:gluconate kinase
MGRRNYLIEGVSCTGKSAVCRELRRRGYAAVDGDRELAYQGDPATGERTEGFCHEHHIWDVGEVRRLAASQDDEATFFCGGSRNFKQFMNLFDHIFVLDVDADTLNERLHNRRDDDWGKSEIERNLILRLHATKGDVPGSGIVVDATRPLASVVDEILSHAPNTERQKFELRLRTILSREKLLDGLSQQLPDVVDQLTPNGRVPNAQEAESVISNQ